MNADSVIDISHLSCSVSNLMRKLLHLKWPKVPKCAKNIISLINKGKWSLTVFLPLQFVKYCQK